MAPVSGLTANGWRIGHPTFDESFQAQPVPTPGAMPALLADARRQRRDSIGQGAFVQSRTKTEIVGRRSARLGKFFGGGAAELDECFFPPGEPPVAPIQDAPVAFECSRSQWQRDKRFLREFSGGDPRRQN